jgi:hypothetical protein
MKHIARAVSAVALLGTIAPSMLFVSGRIDLPQVQNWMLVATVAWFATAPLWMDNNRA